MNDRDRPQTPPNRTGSGRAPLGDVTNTPFATPRHRKTPQTSKNARQSVSTKPIPPPKAWPRFKKEVPVETVSEVAEKIFGYKPDPWQLETFERIAKGYDTFALAGTGMGKSLPFALLAIAAELTGTEGTVMVISPLKSLEVDQMTRFNLDEVVQPDGTTVKITAVAINEDNKDDSVFKELEKGTYRICYASPECLLRNETFKKLFRREKFRDQLLVMSVDEAHVIKDWKDNFRKDYDELGALKVIVGSEIPWAAFTATCSTSTFETIFDALGMGRNRPFWGIDMGADRPNLVQWVRRMEFSKRSMGDLFAFVPRPEDLHSPGDLVKSILYFKSRSQARKAFRKCRKLLPPEYRSLVGVYTATNSQPHKDDVIAALKGNRLRWVFATMALGMGLDVPDIERVVIYGVCPLSEMYQKGGRAARDRSLQGQIIWLVEPWAFEPPPPEADVVDAPAKKVGKKEEKDAERRTKMDPAAREYLDCPNQNKCFREFVCEHFRPSPTFPGLQIRVIPAANRSETSAVSWRDTQWALVRSNYSQLSREWVLTDKDLDRLVTSAHTLVNASVIDSALLRTLSQWICASIILDKLIEFLISFRDDHHKRHTRTAAREPPRKRVNTGKNQESAPNTSSFRVLATPSTEAASTATFEWSWA